MDAEEKWARVPFLPQYEASSLGRIRCVPFIGKMPHGGARAYGGKPTFGQWARCDERYVMHYRGKTYRVARMVCAAFHGPPPPGAYCLHIDEDSRNNKPENLKWGTQKENLNAPGFLEYCRSRTGDNNPVIKGRRQP